MTPSYRAWLKAKLDELDRQYGRCRHFNYDLKSGKLVQYTDEFTIAIKDIIPMLVENEKGVPMMICGGCGAPCREWPPGPAICTVCNELAR